MSVWMTPTFGWIPLLILFAHGQPLVNTKLSIASEYEKLFRQYFHGNHVKLVIYKINLC